MLFSSIPFLFWFLPGVLILYAAAPGSLKNTVLLLSSLFFYGWGEPRYVIWMMLAILMAYIFGLLIERYQSVPKLARLFLALSVSSSLLMLGYFKYADFFIRNVNAVTGCSISLLNITLPIGISFYTFQIHGGCIQAGCESPEKSDRPGYICGTLSSADRRSHRPLFGYCRTVEGAYSYYG